MLHSLRDLMHGRLDVADRKIRTDEVFLDPEDRRLRYLAVDIGGWFEVDEVIVSADLLVPPDAQRDHWTLRLDEAALDGAPRWSAGAEPADLTGWPPIIVGPFGGTYAPMLLYEQMLARGSGNGRGAPDSTAGGARGDEIVYRMDRATEWLGTAAFGTDGELGHVEDMLFEDGTLAIEWLVLGHGGVFGHKTVEVPISAVRHMARQGTHLVLDISSDEAGLTAT
jgi:hypothetical protein